MSKSKDVTEVLIQVLQVSNQIRLQGFVTEVQLEILDELLPQFDGVWFKSANKINFSIN